MRISSDLILDAADMSADVTSEVVSIEHLPIVGVWLAWSGTPTGSLKVQGAPRATGPWLDVTSAIALAGSAGSQLVKLPDEPSHFMRIFYDATSGAGNLTAHVAAKGA